MSTPNTPSTAPYNLESIRSQVFPPGNCRETMALVASLTGQKRGPEQVAGYHPEKVYETMRNSSLFWAWFEALPEDLTGVDLSPLYRLCFMAEERHALQKRELSWEPNPDNLGDEYNGPIGEDERPHARNAVKWARAFAAKETAYRDRFERDLIRMGNGDMPERLREAAIALSDLALTIDARDPDDFGEFEQLGDLSDHCAIDAAIRVCFNALCEIEPKARTSAKASLAALRDQVEHLEEVVGGAA